MLSDGTSVEGIWAQPWRTHAQLLPPTRPYPAAHEALRSMKRYGTNCGRPTLHVEWVRSARQSKFRPAALHRAGKFRPRGMTLETQYSKSTICAIRETTDTCARGLPTR